MPEQKLLSQLDPRFKLGAALALSLCTACLTTISAALAAVLAAFILQTVFGPPLKKTIARLIPANTFLAFMWIVLPLTYPASSPDQTWTLFDLISVSTEGLKTAALISLKANAIMTLFIAMISGMPVSQMGSAMQTLAVPEKLVMIFVFAYRYIFEIEKEYKRALTALRLRGFTPGTNAHTYRTTAYLFSMTLIRSWERAQRVYQAMLLRGFNGKFRCLQKLKTTRLEWFFSLTVALMLLAITGINLL